MLISINWLQTYFEKKLPSPQKIADALTFHAFEIEDIVKTGSDTVIDVKVLPNRAHDCLSHEGIAKEISAIMSLPLQNSEKRGLPKSSKGVPTWSLQVIDTRTERYLGVVLSGIKVGPSPKWLQERLTSLGARSINNVVDATNFVLFSIGQPLHAFDFDKIENRSIVVRPTKKGEHITLLDGTETLLPERTMVIADAKSPLAIAGIKGGKKAEVTSETTTILLEAGSFEASTIRRTAQSLGLKTDASKRFENTLAPALAEKGMHAVVDLIRQIAGGNSVEIGSLQEYYPKQRGVYMTGASVNELNDILGTKLTEKDIGDVFHRLGLSFEYVDSTKKALQVAKKYIGVPYLSGASITYQAPKFFDCSSFVAYAYSRGGVSLPRMTVDQFLFGTSITLDEILPGDIVFANTKEGKIHKVSVEFLPGTPVKVGVDHCGIYLGAGNIIHATRTTGKVVIESLSKCKQFANIVGVRRMSEPGTYRFAVSVPEERLDLKKKEDLAEEVGRILGYDIVPTAMPISQVTVPEMNHSSHVISQIREVLLGAGFSETYTYSFGNLGDVEVLNPLAKDKRYLRNSLCPSLRVAVQENLKYREGVKLFEVGTVFTQGGETLALEKTMLVCTIGRRKVKAVTLKEDFAELKGVLQAIALKLGLAEIELRRNTDRPLASVIVYGEVVGHISATELELDLGKVTNYFKDNRMYRAPSKYPSIIRDISLFVTKETTVGEVEMLIREAADTPLLKKLSLFDVFESDEKKSFAFRLLLQSDERTLADEEASQVALKVIAHLEEVHPEWEVRK